MCCLAAADWQGSTAEMDTDLGCEAVESERGTANASFWK